MIVMEIEDKNLGLMVLMCLETNEIGTSNRNSNLSMSERNNEAEQEAYQRDCRGTRLYTDSGESSCSLLMSFAGVPIAMLSPTIILSITYFFSPRTLPVQAVVDRETVNGVLRKQNYCRIRSATVRR